MNIRSEKTQPLNKKTAALCAFVFEDSKEPLGLPKLPEKLNTTVKQSIKETQGKFESLSIIHTHQFITAEKIIIAGLGKKNKATKNQEKLRNPFHLFTKLLRILNSVYELKLK